MRAVEGAVSARPRCPGELANELRKPETGRDPEVPGLEPEQRNDLAVPPEERRDERRPAVSASREIEPPARSRA